MDNKEIQKKIKEGWVLARAIIEVAGKPKKHVEDTLKGYIKNIGSERIIVVKSEVSPAKKHDDIFAAFTEMEILFKSINDLVYFCFDYMPSNIEVYDPQELVYKTRELNSFINTMQAKLHDANIAAKTIKQRNENLNDSFTKLMKNFIAVVCINGKTLVELEKIIGVPAIHIEKVLNVLIKEERMKKVENKYITTK